MKKWCSSLLLVVFVTLMLVLASGCGGQEEAGSTVVLAGRVFPLDRSASFHVVSFIRLKDDRITELDEYWADDGPAPEWRRKMCIGKPIPRLRRSS